MTNPADNLPMLIGANYYPVFFPDHEWTTDFAAMAASGLNSVRTAELLCSWDRLEIVEGKPDFGWLDTSMALAEDNDLWMILGTGSATPPAWLARKYPDVHIEAADGTHYPTGGLWNWASHNHPGYRQEVARWIDLLVRRYKDHPKLVAWQINNEPAYPFIPEEGGRIRRFDYGHHTAHRFRLWLRDRYDDINSLNAAWRSLATNIAYSEWSQIDPPRITTGGWGVVGAWADWEEFRAEDFAAFIAWESSLVRSLDPGRPTMTNTFVMDYNDPFGVRTGVDQWRLADAVDAIGFDLYPGLNGRWREQPEYVSFFLDQARSIALHRKKAFWLPELECGPIDGWFLGPRSDSDATDIARFTVQALGHGVKEISYHPWRECPPMPVHWGAPADLDGTPNVIAHAIHDVALVVENNPDLFRHATPAPASIAILYSRSTAIHMAAVEQERFYETALRGAYTAFWEAGLEVDFLTPREIAEGSLDSYELLVLPFVASMGTETGDAIAAYVERGGAVIGSAKCPQVDLHGSWYRTKPGAGLAAMFGVVQTWIETRDRPEVTLTAEAPIEGPVRACGGSHHVATVEVTSDATVVGHFADGQPALVHRRHGQGQTLFAATHLDHARIAHDDVAAGQILSGFARSIGIRPHITMEPRMTGVDARRLDHGDHSLLVVTNSTEKDVAAAVTVAGRVAIDLVNKHSLTVTDGVVSIDIGPRGWRILATHPNTAE